MKSFEHAKYLGRKARDEISGWEGTLTARYEYLNGCIRYEISGTDKDGKPEGFVFDEQQILLLPDVTDEAPDKPARAVGGPRGSRPIDR